MSRSIAVFAPDEFPLRVQHGESLTFTAILSHAKDVTGNRVAITWRYEDDDPQVTSVDERRF